MRSIIKDERGLAALISVVAVLAIIVTLGLTTAAVSVNQLALSQGSSESDDALQAADSCVDEAMFRLKLNSGYTGGSITVGDGSCTVSVAGAGSTRTVTAGATSVDSTRANTTSVTLTGNIAATSEATKITNWEE